MKSTKNERSDKVFRIYTKEKDSKELFNVNLTKEEVEKVMGGNIFLDHPDIDKENCVIVEQEQPFLHPTFADNVIREKTREELVAEGIEVDLQEGEIIQDKKIVAFEKPSKYHAWQNDNWAVNLEKVKEEKLEEFKKIRDEKCKENLEMNGSLFQVRNTEDRGKFDRILLGIVAQVIKAEEVEEWRLADNTYKTFTYQELSKIPKLYSDREREIFKKFKELDDELKRANSVQEMEKIKWE